MAESAIRLIAGNVGALCPSTRSLDVVGTSLKKQDGELCGVRWGSGSSAVAAAGERSPIGADLGAQWRRGGRERTPLGHRWGASELRWTMLRSTGSRDNSRRQSYESFRGRWSDGEGSDLSDSDEDAFIGRVMYSKSRDRSWREGEEEYKAGSRYKFRDRGRRRSTGWEWENDEQGADFAQYMWLNPWIREAVGGLKNGLPFLIVAMPFLLMGNPIFLAIAPVAVAIFPSVQRFFQAPLQNTWRLLLSLANYGIWDEQSSRNRRRKHRRQQRERTYARSRWPYGPTGPTKDEPSSKQESDRYGGW